MNSAVTLTQVKIKVHCLRFYRNVAMCGIQEHLLFFLDPIDVRPCFVYVHNLGPSALDCEPKDCEIVCRWQPTLTTYLLTYGIYIN